MLPPPHQMHSSAIQYHSAEPAQHNANRGWAWLGTWNVWVISWAIHLTLNAASSTLDTHRVPSMVEPTHGDDDDDDDDDDDNDNDGDGASISDAVRVASAATSVAQ